MTDDKALLMRTMKRITDLRAALVAEYPFFGRLLLHLTPALADCGTACTDMKRIIFDPLFVGRLSDPELKFVILHEVMHCVLKHCLRGRTLDGFLYNVACDIVVNSLVLEAAGLLSFTVAGEEPMHLAPDGQEGRIYTAEEVYAMLLKKANRPALSIGNVGGGGGANGGSPAGPPSGTTDGADGASAGSAVGAGSPAGKASNGSGAGSPGGTPAGGGLPDFDAEGPWPGTIDTHDIWKELSDDERCRLGDQWEIRIRQASKNCGKGSGIPLGIRRYLAETDRMSRTNWRQVLADFIRHNRADYTFMRRDVRYGGDIIMPSFVEDLYGEAAEGLWFCVDASGSVSDSMLATVFSEILAACRQLDELSGEIAFFDTVLSAFTPFGNEEDVAGVKPVGGGGTSFHCIFRRLAECPEEERPVGIVILTDGYAPIPREADALGVPVLWAIVNSEREPDWGTVIHIEE